MNENSKALLTKLTSKYPLAILEDGKLIRFNIIGIEEVFRVSDSGKEIIISTESWHEHFGKYNSYEDAIDFFDDLLSGKAYILVKYRGDFPVAHSLHKINKDNNDITLSRTGSLISPFWRKKSIKKLYYTIPTKS